jgi:small-conductance mechanosensitive channel
LIIGVDYDSDMGKAKRLIEEVLDQKKILKTPPSKVLMQTFGEAPSTLESYFGWKVLNFGSMNELKL